MICQPILEIVGEEWRVVGHKHPEGWIQYPEEEELNPQTGLCIPCGRDYIMWKQLQKPDYVPSTIPAKVQGIIQPSPQNAANRTSTPSAIPTPAGGTTRTSYSAPRVAAQVNHAQPGVMQGIAQAATNIPQMTLKSVQPMTVSSPNVQTNGTTTKIITSNTIKAEVSNIVANQQPGSRVIASQENGPTMGTKTSNIQPNKH